MIILGITSPISWNNAACLLKDGKLVAAVEEERFVKIKHAPRMAPINSIKYCLKIGGISLDDVDYIAIGFESPREHFKLLSRNILHLHSKTDLNFWLTNYVMWDDFWASTLGNRKNLIFVRHHLAHAASAFYLSGFKRSNIITTDGSGEIESGILGVGREKDIEILKSIELKNSLGNLYALFTLWLGFKPHSDEGKVMGLAPYGKTSDLPFIDLSGELPKIDNNKLHAYLGRIPQRVQEAPLENVHKNMAASIQNALEKAVMKLQDYLYEQTGYRQLCLAGGTALNSCMNSVLLNSENVDDIFIQPAANDAGCAIGAAVHVYVQKTGKLPDINFNHAYWGPEYSNEQIKNVIDNSMIKNFEYYDDIEGITSELIAKDKVIGWFQGRIELGSRALGNRSILGNPTNPLMKDIINNSVKHREPWRPFAPSILSESASDYLEDAYPSPFMILTFKVKENKINEIISATHVDGTCRPQTVEKEVNPMYWKLIKNFESRTGVPAIINTSFNIQGQPIVLTPKDAISTFYSTGFDYLAIGNYLIQK